MSEAEMVTEAQWGAFEKRMTAANAGKVAAAAARPVRPASSTGGGATMVPSLQAAFDDAPPVATVALGSPVTIDGVRIATVSFREPTYAEIEAALLGRLRRGALVSALAGQSDGFVEALRYPDADRVIRIAHALLPDLPVR